MTRQHWLVDQLFSMTPGVAHTIVAPGYFADNYLLPMGMAVHLGVFPSLFGNSRNAPPSNEDIARVGVAALMDSFAARRQALSPHRDLSFSVRRTWPRQSDGPLGDRSRPCQRRSGCS